MRTNKSERDFATLAIRCRRSPGAKSVRLKFPAAKQADTVRWSLGDANHLKASSQLAYAYGADPTRALRGRSVRAWLFPRGSGVERLSCFHANLLPAARGVVHSRLLAAPGPRELHAQALEVLHSE